MKPFDKLKSLSKEELIEFVEYCHSMDHIADLLMQHFNRSPDALNYVGWGFNRVNLKTGVAEEFEITLRRTQGNSCPELLAGVTQKYRELEAESQALREALEGEMYIFDPEEGTSYPYSERSLLCDNLAPGRVLQLCMYTVINQQDTWAANVILTRTEDGDYDETEIQWFDSEQAALDAVKGGPDAEHSN